MLPHLIPVGVLVTVPLPDLLTVRVKPGDVIVKVRIFEVAPPGFTTLTCAVPAAAMSLAGIAAVTCVALTNVVVRAAPFHCTTDPDTKLLPFAVSVNAGPPAVALLGDRVVSAGTATAALIVKVSALEVCPPGFTTLTCLPAAAMSLAGIAAVTCVALTNVVVRAVPFHCTADPETKLLPFTVSVNAGPPAVALLGDRVVSAGTATAALS